jgi:hypothetical protein
VQLEQPPRIDRREVMPVKQQRGKDRTGGWRNGHRLFVGRDGFADRPQIN